MTVVTLRAGMLVLLVYSCGQIILGLVLLDVVIFQDGIGSCTESLPCLPLMTLGKRLREQGNGKPRALVGAK